MWLGFEPSTKLGKISITAESNRPENMNLFSLKKNKLSTIESKPFEYEKDIQKIVEDNVEELFNLSLVCTEFRVDEFRFDSVCFDEEANSFVIIEYKKDYSFSVVDQGFSYLSTMLQNKSDFILEYNETKGKTLKRNQVDWSQSKVIFVSPSFTPHQKNSINFKDMPFELWEIKRFSKDLISVDQIISSPKESVKGLSKNTKFSNVNKEIKTYDLQYLLSGSSQKVKDLWGKIDARITKSDFSGTKYIYKKSYLRFCSENFVVICYFKFMKEVIDIEIMGGTIMGDGHKTKGFVELDDYKNLTKRKKEIWKDYERYLAKKRGEIWKGDRKGMKDPVHHRYELKIKDQKNINYLVDLLQQRYHAVFNPNVKN